ncbi:hypothetical protein FACS1894132_06160 [Clostridia bacterium]|nr:hypothetical protein FACS1894132_06160 [Clostridia bacterium]
MKSAITTTVSISSTNVTSETTSIVTEANINDNETLTDSAITSEPEAISVFSPQLSENAIPKPSIITTITNAIISEKSTTASQSTTTISHTSTAKSTTPSTTTTTTAKPTTPSTTTPSTTKSTTTTTKSTTTTTTTKSTTTTTTTTTSKPIYTGETYNGTDIPSFKEIWEAHRGEFPYSETEIVQNPKYIYTFRKIDKAIDTEEEKLANTEEQKLAKTYVEQYRDILREYGFDNKVKIIVNVRSVTIILN